MEITEFFVAYTMKKKCELFKNQTKRYEMAKTFGCSKETLYNIGHQAALERQEFQKGPEYWYDITILPMSRSEKMLLDCVFLKLGMPD